MKYTVVLLLLLSIISCKKYDTEKVLPKRRVENQQELQIPGAPKLADTTDGKPYIAILPKNADQNISVTQYEMQRIDKLLQDAVAVYNLEMGRKYTKWKKEDPAMTSTLANFKIDLRYYKRQYITSINKDGEKEVQINCFCEYTDDDRWQQGILYINDGGKCYFRVTVNLSKNSFSNFNTNGEA